MKSEWELVVSEFRRRRKADGLMSAALRSTVALGACLYRQPHRELLALGLFRRHVATLPCGDVLAHVNHRHYLSRKLGYRQRVACALSHYRFEDSNYDEAYKAAVYGDDGLELWADTVDSTRYTLRLIAPTNLRHEGGTSVVLFSGELRLCEMSFAWVDAGTFGATGGIVPFVTRNQSARHDTPELRAFREAYPQNSPPYFCMAAMHGIAAAHGCRRVAAIKHDCQIAFVERLARSFRNSYNDFWQSFGATELDHQAMSIPVPLELPDLSTVKAKHRKRALERRRHWGDIADGAHAAVSQHRADVAAAPRATRIDRLMGSVMTNLPIALTLAMSV